MSVRALDVGYRRPPSSTGGMVDQGPVLAMAIMVLLCALSAVFVARHPQAAPGYEATFPAGL